MRTDAQTPQPIPAIALPERQSVASPAHTAAMPSLVPPPPTFTEFMTTVPQVATHPLSIAAPSATCSLQTACYVPMHVPKLALTGPMTGATETFRPYCPGLMSLATLLVPFTDVISYRSYRLGNTRSESTLVASGNITRIKRRFDDLYPGFAPFGGSPTILLLAFIATLRERFNALEAAEEIAAMLLTYYLEGSAKTLYLTDNVMQVAYEQVTNARQKSNEDENEFKDRIATAFANAATHFGTGNSLTTLSVACCQRQGTQSLIRFDTSPLTNRETLRWRDELPLPKVIRSGPALSSRRPQRTRILGTDRTSCSWESPKLLPIRVRSGGTRTYRTCSRVPINIGLTSGHETLSTRIRLRVSSSRSCTPALVEEQPRLR